MEVEGVAACICIDKKQIYISNKAINISYLLLFAMKENITSNNSIKEC